MTIVYVLLSLLAILIFVVGIMVAFALGYTVADKKRYETHKLTKPPPDLTCEQEEKIKKAQKEYDNFLKYDGSEQG